MSYLLKRSPPLFYCLSGAIINYPPFRAVFCRKSLNFAGMLIK